MTRLMLERPLVGLRAVDRGSTAVPAVGATVLDPVGDLDRMDIALKRSAQRLLEGITGKLQGLDDLVARRLDEMAGYVVELGLGLAASVLQAEIAQGRYEPAPAVLECLRGALMRTRDGGIRVCLNPADLSHVLATLEECDVPEAKRPEVRFEVDPALPRGGCRVETSVGTIVHDPEQILARAMQRIREEIAP